MSKRESQLVQLVTLATILLLAQSKSTFDGKIISNFSDFFVLSAPQERLKLLSKRQMDKCGNEVLLEDCIDREYARKLSKLKTNRFVASFQSKCHYDEVVYKWVLMSLLNPVRPGENRDTSKDIQFDNPNNVHVLQPFVLKTGEYAIHVAAEAFAKGASITTYTVFDDCRFEVNPEVPIAIIEGGNERIVESGRSFRVDGSKSVDRDVPRSGKGRLIYMWKCEVLEGTIKDYCQNKFEESSVEVPAKYALKDYKYIFTLSVKTKDHADWITSTQTITIKNNAAELEIICEKNCPPVAPKTHPDHLTFLRSKCLKNCEAIAEHSYEWTVEAATFDYAKSTQFGRNTDKFIVKKGVFRPGIKYEIRLTLTGGRVGGCVKIIVAQSPPKIDSCEAKPAQGIAIETKFGVDCKYTGNVTGFEIFTSKNGQNVELTKSSNLSHLEFVLPVNVEVFVKIVDEDNFQDVHKLNVQVNPLGNKTKLVVLNESIKDLIKEKNFELAIQITNGIIEEIDKEPAATITEMKQALLRNFEDISITSQEKAQQISAIVTRLVHDNKSESEPVQAEIATKLCKAAGLVELEQMRGMYYPGTLSSEAQENAEMLMGCGETDTKPHFDILKPTPLPITITTPFPILPIPVIPEDYPDYVTDDSVAEKIKKYETASENFVDICRTNLQVMALTAVEGEEALVASTELCRVQITRKLGNELAKQEIEAEGVSILLSDRFKTITESVDVMVCSWSKDIFWWNALGQVALTNVVFLEISEEFDEPNRVILDIHDDQQITVHEVEDANMSIVRIDVRKREAFFVEFHNLSDSDWFQVLISDFAKPELAEVRSNGVTVSKKQSVLYGAHDHDYDGWHYVSLVPNSAQQASLKYSISVYSLSCYSWDAHENLWKFACKGNSNSTREKLECECGQHSSILAGMVFNNPIKVDSEVINPDFEIVILCCPIVFICLCVVFAFYCFFLVFMTKRRKIRGWNLFLPADISSSSLFVYLVQIRTGKNLSAATSSNICIKIFGNKRTSKSHILNYPDPHRKIFQWGSNDWFVLPTHRYLGEVTEIALWSDHTGRSPSWFCKDVTVYDLQSDRKWRFRINTWFDLPPKGQVYVKSSFSEAKTKERIMMMLPSFWPRRSHQASFTNFKKSTLLLSVIMWIFACGLILYGLPRLQMNDGFASVASYDLHAHVIWIGFASALAAFLIHMPLVWLFRNCDDGPDCTARFSIRIAHYCWSFLTLTITSTMTILLIFGFWIPTITGWLWLTSSTIAIVVYFLILENLYEIIFNIFHKPTDNIKWFAKLKTGLSAIDVQRKYLFRKFGEDLLRPYFSHLYKPLDENAIKERISIKESRFKMVAAVEDTIMFVCYVTLLCLVIFANRNRLTVANHEEMLDLLTGLHLGPLVKNRSFSTIRSTNDLYHYINYTLIPTLQANQWYSRYVVDDPGMMVDFHNKYLGVARLRQQRITSSSCKIPQEIKLPKNSTCRSEFYLSKPTFDRFGPEENDFSRMAPIWKYTKPELAGVSLVVGKFGVYHGGGYIAPLGRTIYNSYVNLDYLKSHQWVDAQTRVIFVEFLTYNVNSNLFNAVRIVVEKSASGYFRIELELTTTQLLFVKDEDELAQIAILLSFAVIIFIFTIKVMCRVRRGKLLFFKDLWTVVDLVIVGLSFACFGLFMHRAHLVGKFLEKIENAKKNEFVDYFNLFQEDCTFVLVAALLVFVSTVRLWKLSRLATVFKITEATLSLSASPILTLLLYQVIVLLAFGLSGYMIFGTTSHHFKDIPDTLITIVLMSMDLHEHFDTESLTENHPVMGSVYYSIFMIISLWIYTIYVTIIMIYYYEAQLVHSNEDEFAKLKNFLADEFVYYKTWARVRLKGGHGIERQHYVSAKADEHRYANCMTLSSNQIELMCCIAIHNLRRHSSVENKLGLMRRIALSACRADDEVDIFYAVKAKHNVTKIVHDLKMERMAQLVERILRQDDKSRQRAELKYQKVITQQLKKLNYISQVLQTMLQIVSNIETG